MSSNSRLDGFLDMATSLIKLPKHMTPQKEVFELLGFKFQDVGDNILLIATLPEGWMLEKEDMYWTNIFDENGRKRGISFYKGVFYNRDGNMRLLRRFNITHEHINPQNRTSPVRVYVKDFDGTVLYEAGMCNKTFSNEYEVLINKAKEFLKNNYPEYENPTKYWD